MEKTKIYRAIDANLNRAVEGLRVVEDALRFMRDNAATTAALRELRHELRRCAELLPGGNARLLAARDSAGDVARNAPPRRKTDARELVSANLKRAQEAARSIEELSKLLSPRAASRFGELRFRIYDIEKDVAAAMDGRAKPAMPPAPFLYAVADYATLSSGGSFAFLRDILGAGCAVVQLREKNRPDGELLRMARKVAAEMKNTGALFFVNDRLDIALAAGAHGVHLGADDLPVDAARRIAGGKLLIGTSTHSLKQALSAAATKPDYIAIGPVFASPTKTERKPVGPELIISAREKISLPIVAIGGITAENASRPIAAGASAVAVITTLTQAKNPRSEAKRIIRAMRKESSQYPVASSQGKAKTTDFRLQKKKKTSRAR